MNSINDFLYAWFGTDGDGNTSVPLTTGQYAKAVVDGVADVSNSVSDFASEAEPWAVGVGLLVGLFLLVILVHEAKA